MASRSLATSARASVWSGLVIGLASWPRLWAALRDRSVFTPQEIYDGTDPAHRVAFGWGFLSRELRDGAHSWLFPWLLGLEWKGASALGVHTANGLVTTAKVTMALLSLSAVWLAMALARRLHGERAAVLTGVLLAICPPLVALGSRTFPEVMSLPLVVGALLLVEARGRGNAVTAGALLGFASALHYELFALTLALVVVLFVQRRSKDARALLFAAVTLVGFGGMVDWPASGAPFRALATEIKTTFGTPPPVASTSRELSYYADHLAASIGVTFAIVLLGMGVVWRRVAPLAFIVAIYLAAISCVRDRELRYALPIIPVIVAAGAGGLLRLADGLGSRRWPILFITLGCCAHMAWIAHAPTRGELGFGASDWNTWHSGEDYFRATFDAGRTPDLCGVVYVANEPVWTGGYTYLHRDVPIFFDTHPDHLAAANAVVGGPSERLPAGWRKVATEGSYTLWERPGTCSPPPADWTMNLP